MTGPFKPETAGIERRLGRRDSWGPPPALRRRVLTAVDDVLATSDAVRPAGPDTMSFGWAWAAVAAGIAIMAAAWWTPRETVRIRTPLALVERVRAAGLADDTLLAVTRPERARSVSPPSAGEETSVSMIRAADSRQLLQENL